MMSFPPLLLGPHLDSEKDVPNSKFLLLVSKLFSINEKPEPALVIMLPIPTAIALGTANRRGMDVHVTSSALDKI